MNREDRKVLVAIDEARPRIARAIGLISNAFRQGGRLVFVGAGTSGRLGVLEAAECPPTFNTKPGQVLAIMAGGKQAVFKSKEGAEDSVSEADAAVTKQVRKGDVVVGVAASGVTPFVHSALRSALRRKAHTVLVTCNPNSYRVAEVTIVLRTGPEVLSGSTRLKAGTACKMVLNMLTTASMVQIGKVYGNRMVDVQPKSRKLVERGVRLIRDLGPVDEAAARRLLNKARGHVKTAIVMARMNMTYREAEQALKRADGFLGKIFKEPAS